MTSEPKMLSAKRMMDMAVNVVLIAAVGYAALLGFMYLSQRKMMYFPDRTPPSREAGLVTDMQAVDLQTADGLSLLSWYRAPSAPGLPTLVMFHGNAGNISGRARKARAYLDAGLGVLLVGYRGYGGNDGEPTEAGFYTDSRAAVSFLQAKGVRAKDMVLWGESLGTGVAVHLAFELAKTEPAGAVILEAPFSSVADVAASVYPYLPVNLLLKDRYDSIAKIAEIKTPLFIVHGDLDKTVPFRFGRKLFDSAIQPKTFHQMKGAAHNNLSDFGVEQENLRFIQQFYSF